MRGAILAVVFLSSTALGGSKSPLPITTCGQHVARWQVGVLQNDVQCPPSLVCTPGCPDIALPCGDPYVPTISCHATCGADGRCTSAECPNATDLCILRPGGSFVVGIDVEAGGEVDLNGHTLADAYYGIVSFSLGRVIGRETVQGPGSVTGSHVALSAGKLTASDVTLSGNGLSIGSENGVKLTNVSITGGDSGVFASNGGKATNLTVTGAGSGIYSNRGFRLTDSSVTGNTVDITTFRVPRLVRSACDVSVRLVRDMSDPSTLDPAGPWGICSAD
jgi:hypothetical protein